MKRDIVRMHVLFCLLVLIGACKSNSMLNTIDHLTVTPWELNTLNGKAVDAKDFMAGLPFLVFDKDGSLSGSTGCNSMMGNYEVKNNNISLNPGGMTRMACPGSGEMLFLEAMRKAKNLDLPGGKLVLLDGATEIMTLVPRK